MPVLRQNFLAKGKIFWYKRMIPYIYAQTFSDFWILKRNITQKLYDYYLCITFCTCRWKQREKEWLTHSCAKKTHVSCCLWCRHVVLCVYICACIQFLQRQIGRDFKWLFFFFCFFFFFLRWHCCWFRAFAVIVIIMSCDLISNSLAFLVLQ